MASATSRHEMSTPGLSCCHGPFLMRKWKPCSTARERLGTSPNARCTLSRPRPERIMTWFCGSEQSVCSNESVASGTGAAPVEQDDTPRGAPVGEQHLHAWHGPCHEYAHTQHLPCCAHDGARHGGAGGRWAGGMCGRAARPHTCCVSSALKSCPMPTMRKEARPKPTAIQCSSCFFCRLLRSARKRRPQSSEVCRCVVAGAHEVLASARLHLGGLHLQGLVEGRLQLRLAPRADRERAVEHAAEAGELGDDLVRLGADQCARRLARVVPRHDVLERVYVDGLANSGVDADPRLLPEEHAGPCGHGGLLLVVDGALGYRVRGLDAADDGGDLFLHDARVAHELDLVAAGEADLDQHVARPVLGHGEERGCGTLRGRGGRWQRAAPARAPSRYRAHQPVLRRAVRRHRGAGQQRGALLAEGVELLELGRGGRGHALLLDDGLQQLGVDAEGGDLDHDVAAAVVDP
eukprot:scaffold116230_cov39-Phaeocystis_antarctica.AAC.2